MLFRVRPGSAHEAGTPGAASSTNAYAGRAKSGATNLTRIQKIPAINEQSHPQALRLLLRTTFGILSVVVIPVEMAFDEVADEVLNSEVSFLDVLSGPTRNAHSHVRHRR